MEWENTCLGLDRHAIRCLFYTHYVPDYAGVMEERVVKHPDKSSCPLWSYVCVSDSKCDRESVGKTGVGLGKVFSCQWLLERPFWDGDIWAKMWRRPQDKEYCNLMERTFAKEENKGKVFSGIEVSGRMAIILRSSMTRVGPARRRSGSGSRWGADQAGAQRFLQEPWLLLSQWERAGMAGSLESCDLTFCLFLLRQVLMCFSLALNLLCSQE